MGKIKNYLMDCADRLARSIWDDGIASKEDAEILADYIIFEQVGEFPYILATKEITADNVDEYTRAMCSEVIKHAGEIFTNPEEMINDAKELLEEVYTLSA